MPDVKPADQYEHFSEMRARQFLTQIANLGPRPSGSEALEVFNFFLNFLNLFLDSCVPNYYREN